MGPQLIKNVTVIGFEEGIQQTNFDYYTVYENILLQDQRTIAMTVRRGNAIIRKLTSDNTVPVLNLTENLASAAVYEGAFTGATSGTAVTNSGTLFIRDLNCTGYSKVVENLTGSLVDVAAGAGTTFVSEFYSHTPKYAFDTPSHSLDLVAPETPSFDTMDVATDWINVVNYGATPDNSSNDDAVGINAAIAAANTANKPIVYLPRGYYIVSQPIIVTGSVKKIVGCGTSLGRATGFTGNLVSYTGTGTTILEHLRFSGPVSHDGSGNLALVACNLIYTYSNSASGTGKTFFEDAQADQVTINGPHSCFARELNIESSGTAFTNNGGLVWILGIKTEHTDSRVVNLNNGILEILGSCFYANSTPSVPLIVNNNSQFSGFFRVGGTGWPTAVRETRGATTIDKTSSSLWSDVAGQMRAFYTGYTNCGPQDDVYVRDGTYASTNFNSSNMIEVKAANTSGFTRKGLIKFNLNGKTTNVTAANLDLRVVSVDASNPPSASSPIQIQFYNVSDSWLEQNATWNTLPAPGTLIGIANVTGNNQTITMNLTNAYNTERAGDKVLSLYLQCVSGSNRFVAFSDRSRAETTPLLRTTP